MAVPLDMIEAGDGLAKRPVSVEPLTVSHVTTEQGLWDLEVEWRLLETQATPLPFMSFDWVVAWWQHLRSRKPSVYDELLVCTFRSTSGELVGVAPLMITHRPSCGPWRFRQLQFLGADPNLTEVRGVVAAPQWTDLVYLTLLDDLSLLSGSWNMASLTGIPPGSLRLEQQINSRFATNVWASDIANPILSLRPSWEEFKSALSRNMKESLRKCYNAPKKAGLFFEFEVATAVADVEPALNAFFDLHRARSVMSSAVNHNDCFSTHKSRRFLVDVCVRFAARGMLRIFQIRCQNSIVATRIGFVIGDSLYLYYSGYDPAYQKFSVMTTVVAEAIKYAISQDFRFVNLSTGSDISKTRWSPAVVNYRSVEFSSQSRRDIVMHRTFRAVTAFVSRGSADSRLGRLFTR